MTEMTVNAAADIDGAAYFDMLMRGLSDEAKADIQMQLWALLAHRTQRYTMGDSSSVREETAQALLRSVCWCIGTYLKRTTADDAARRLGREPVAALWELGQRAIGEDVRRGKARLRVLQAHPPAVTTRAYRDTVDALPMFFKYYDAAFFADDVPGAMIDYPLCMPVAEIGGVAYVNAYMHRLMLENAFCRALDAAELRYALRTLGRDYDDQFAGIFETAFTLCVGRALLSADVRTLGITAHDRAILRRLLSGLSPAALESRIVRSADDIAAALGITDAAVIEYMKAAGRQLVPRLCMQIESGDLAGVFRDANVHQNTPEPVFVDGTPMPDEALRAMIDELRDCRYTSDKIAMVRRGVHSIRDLIEVIGAGFLDDEWPALFAALGDGVLSALRRLADDSGIDAAWADALAAAMTKF
jgi:hypothetical protein